jgi:hypothetical protein
MDPRGHATGTGGHSYSIQEGGVRSGRLRSSYLLKNGPKVTLSEFAQGGPREKSNSGQLISIRFQLHNHSGYRPKWIAIAFRCWIN